MFGITSPGCQCPMEHTAFNAYAYHQQQIEDYIDALMLTDDPNDWSNQHLAAISAGLDLGSLTANDIDYIEREVAKRR